MLATDNVQTLAVFIYKDINWGERAQIGFNVGDGYTSFVFPEALSDQTQNIDEYSNVGEPGVFIYRIDSKSFSQSLSLSLSLSLSPHMMGVLNCSLSSSLQQFTHEHNVIILLQ